MTNVTIRRVFYDKCNKGEVYSMTNVTIRSEIMEGETYEKHIMRAGSLTNE